MGIVSQFYTKYRGEIWKYLDLYIHLLPARLGGIKKNDSSLQGVGLDFLKTGLLQTLDNLLGIHEPQNGVAQVKKRADGACKKQA